MIIKGVNEKGETVDIEVSPDGNLGLLAAGYKGILLWKEARKAVGLPDFSDPETQLIIKDPVNRKRNLKKNAK